MATAPVPLGRAARRAALTLTLTLTLILTLILTLCLTLSLTRRVGRRRKSTCRAMMTSEQTRNGISAAWLLRGCYMAATEQVLNRVEGR